MLLGWRACIVVQGMVMGCIWPATGLIQARWYGDVGHGGWAGMAQGFLIFDWWSWCKCGLGAVDRLLMPYITWRFLGFLRTSRHAGPPECMSFCFAYCICLRVPTLPLKIPTSSVTAWKKSHQLCLRKGCLLYDIFPSFHLTKNLSTQRSICRLACAQTQHQLRLQQHLNCRARSPMAVPLCSWHCPLWYPAATPDPSEL